MYFEVPYDGLYHLWYSQQYAIIVVLFVPIDNCVAVVDSTIICVVVVVDIQHIKGIIISVVIE